MIERRLAHGYTNKSWLAGELVVKQYQAVHAAHRLRIEVAALAHVAASSRCLTSSTSTRPAAAPR